MKTVLDRVANYIEYQENNSVLNARESEALASAKSLLVCADTINNTFNNTTPHHSQSLRQFLEEDEEEVEEVVEQPRFINGEEVKPLEWDSNLSAERIIQETLIEFAEAYGVPYEKFGKTEGVDYATSKTFPVGDGSFEFVVGFHID